MKTSKFIDRIANMCLNEASTKCFDEFFKTPYKKNYGHIKSRKIKQARRKIIRYYISWGHVKDASEIKLIIDDYVYWICRNTHKLLHPNTPDSYYLES